MSDPRFSLLVERCLDREASADEMAELQTLLREDAEARERFWEAAEWHALFRQWGEQEWGREAAQAERRTASVPTAFRPARLTPRPRVRPPAKRKVVRFPFAQWGVGIAAVAASVALVLTIKSPAPAPSPVVVVAPVATLAQVTGGAVWNSEKLESGARLKPGRLRLEKGAVVIAFDRGARVVLEGPVDFDVRGDNTSALLAGRLRAHVPPSAHGFKVETPQFTAVDLGTEFGCDLGVNGTGELHVFTGKVDLQTEDARTAPVELSENQAMRIEADVASRIPARPFSFLSENELARRELQKKGDFLGAWRMAGRQLDEDSATVLHFDFEDAAGAVLANKSQRAPSGSDAKVIGCKPAEGRWPGKSAFTFRSADDRMEFALPGRFESLTLLAWVRVDSLHVGPNPLVMERDSGAGGVRWFIHRDGGLGVSVRKTREGDAGFSFLHTEPVINERNFGSWIFVACVLDGATGTATHYLNGERVGARFDFVRVPFQLATAEIGNSSTGESRVLGDPRSNLDGSIDELAVLSAALAPDDIVRLYRQGEPGAD